MIQRMLHVLCGALLLCAACQSYLAAQGTPLPPPDKAPVEIYLTASGKASSFGSLDQSALTVTLDKQPIPVTSIRSAKHDRLLFAVLVDDSTSNAKKGDSIKNVASQLFQGLSAGGNLGFLVVFDASFTVSTRTLKPAEARKALDDVQFRGATALSDAIAKTCTTVLSKIGNPSNPRRVIILLSDGDDNQSHARPQEAIQIAEKEGVSIYSLTVTADTTDGDGVRLLREFTKKTGGQAIINWAEKDGVKDMIAAIDSQWVLSLVPPPSSSQGLHPLMVKSSQKGVQISAPVQIFLQ